MKKLFFPALIVLSVFWFFQTQNRPVSDNFWQKKSVDQTIETASGFKNKNDTIIQDAFKNRQSNLQVRGQGVAIKILPDDLEGSRHQRFILRLGNGQTLLVAHNIDLADRINTLSAGDTVEFYGEYEWSSKGGVIHWTHKDPKEHHVAGWLKHGSRTYQ